MSEKRTIAALAVLVGMSGFMPAYADYKTQVLSQGPVAYWRLGETTPVPLPDAAVNSGSLGAAANGYYLGTVTHPTTGALVGRADTAVWCDGTAGSIVAVPYHPAMNPTNAFSVEAWLSPAAANPSGTLTAALSLGNFADPRSGWLIYQSDTGWNFRMYNQNGLNTSASITGGPAPTPGAWHHVAAVYDGTNAYVYVNGQQAAMAEVPSYVPGRNGSMYIGGRSDNSFWWNGSADEVAFYDKALTAAEIAARYQNGTSASPTTPYDQLILQSGPLAYLRLNEAEYTPPATLPTAVNEGTGGVGLDASYNPGAQTGAEGVSYQGFEADNKGVGLNGVVGHVSTPASLNSLSQFTVMGWVKRGAVKSARGGYFGQNNLLEFGDAGNGSQIEAYIEAYGGNILIPYSFADNSWGFIALTGDGTKAVLYTNGVVAAERAGVVDTYGENAFGFNIGGGGVFNDTGDYFLGNIDEVAIFDKALTPAQIAALYDAANVPPSISEQPKLPNRTLYVGNTLRLSVSAGGVGPFTYQWRKGGQELPGSTSQTFVINQLALADSGQYDVVVTGAYGDVTSAPVNLTVQPAETTVPTLDYVTGSWGFNQVTLWFSEPLDPVTAQDASKYTIPGLQVTSAALSSPAGTEGDNMVILTTATQTPGQTYELTVSGVNDQTLPANTIANTTKSFIAWVEIPGLAFEHYNNLGGAADGDITSALRDPRVVAGLPTTAAIMTDRLDTRVVFPDDSHENYLVRVTGLLTPKVTGNYYFFLRADDASRLYLSTTETLPDPSVDTPIAYEPNCCGPYYEPGEDPATTTNAIPLQAGKSYAILLLLKEAGGGDYAQVAWREANDFTPATDLTPIPGEFLSTYVDPNVDLEFTVQPTDQPGVKPGSSQTIVTEDFNGGPGGFTVVNTDPAPPGPWRYEAGAWLADGGESACTGPYNSQLNSPAYKLTADGALVLTFSHRYSFEGDLWDAGQVRFSVNGGAFTNVAAGNFTTNGYATGVIQGSGVANGQRAFNGDSPGYELGEFITSVVTIGSFKKDDSVVVQFVGAWDDCTTGQYPGWVIESMKLDLTLGATSPTFTSEATASRRGEPVTFAYQWQRNDGTGFVDIQEAKTAVYSFVPTLADFNATFRVVAGVPGKSITSNVVKLYEGNAQPPAIAIARAANGKVVITYEGTLHSSSNADAGYQPVSGAQSPYEVTPSAAGNLFYRSSR